MDEDSGRFRVVIVGAGPSGSALAILLARQGADVTLFDDGRHPELLVGESLVPAVVPILQKLGFEQETASFSRIKPGATFLWSATNRVSDVSALRSVRVPVCLQHSASAVRQGPAQKGALDAGVRHVPVCAPACRAIGHGTECEARARPRDSGGGAGA